MASTLLTNYNVKILKKMRVMEWTHEEMEVSYSFLNKCIVVESPSLSLFLTFCKIYNIFLILLHFEIR